MTFLPYLTLLCLKLLILFTLLFYANQGGWKIVLSLTVSMSSVLLAPTLSNNLLFISKIKKHLNYSVTIHSTHYVFQDNFTKMTIGIGKERGGLYYLEGTKALQSKSDHAFRLTRETSNKENIHLWQCRLGHSFFLIWNVCFLSCLKMFPFLAYEEKIAFMLRIIV